LEPKEETFQALLDLGLTSVQAKVLLALSKLGEATIKNTANTSKLARQEIYRAVNELQNAGFIEKILTSPVRFRPIPLSEILSILLQRKVNKIEELQMRTGRLLKNSEVDKKMSPPPDEEPKFILLPTNEAFIRATQNAMNKGKHSIVGTYTWKGLLINFESYTTQFKYVLRKGVQIRIIAEKPKDVKEFPKAVNDLTKNSLFKIRYTENALDVLYWVLDNREVSILTVPPSTMSKDSLWMWSNSIPLVSAMQGYFEACWNKAIEPRTEILN
jgi:HTH-type transcriptional regulator, sugar sensing transcriptional regulator